MAWDFLSAITRHCSNTSITDYFVEMFAELCVRPDDLKGLSRAAAKRCWRATPRWIGRDAQ